MTHRFVTFTSSFFADLDRQLPVGRSLQLPSRTDFVNYELSTIRERFSYGFDGLPVAIPGRPDYRTMIESGRVVYAFAVVGQLMQDGAVQIMGVKIDTGWPETDDTD